MAETCVAFQKKNVDKTLGKKKNKIKNEWLHKEIYDLKSPITINFKAHFQ